MQEQLPAASLTGDFTIRLDSGQQYLLHERLLTDSSELLERAVTAYKASAPGGDSVMHLPDVLDKNFVLVMEAKYATYKIYKFSGSNSWYCCYDETKGPIWTDAHGTSELLELAAVSHALGCMKMLTLVDHALVKQVCTLLSTADALKLCQQAQQLGLKGLSYEIAIGLVKSMPTMTNEDAARAADVISAILSGARSEVIDLLGQIEARNYVGYPHASQDQMFDHTGKIKAELQARIPPQVTMDSQADLPADAGSES